MGQNLSKEGQPQLRPENASRLLLKNINIKTDRIKIMYVYLNGYDVWYTIFTEEQRRTAGYIWTDYKTNTQIAKELKITPTLDKLLEYKRNWIQHVNRMPRNRLPRVMKRYSPTGRRNHGRPLKRLLDT